MKGYCTINSDASVNIITGEAGYALWINCDLVTAKNMGAVQESYLGFQYCRDMVCNERDTLGDKKQNPR